MRKLTWLVCGVVIGFIAAHFVNESPGGRRFFGRVNRGIEEFQRAFAAGYHEAEADPEGQLSDAEVEAVLRDMVAAEGGTKETPSA